MTKGQSKKRDKIALKAMKMIYMRNPHISNLDSVSKSAYQMADSMISASKV